MVNVFPCFPLVQHAFFVHCTCFVGSAGVSKTDTRGAVTGGFKVVPEMVSIGLSVQSGCSLPVQDVEEVLLQDWRGLPVPPAELCRQRR